MTRRLTMFALVLLLAACASTDLDQRAESPQGRYVATTGNSPVGAIPEVVLHDSARNKDVQFSIEYPTRGTANPLIVFSHGFGGSSRGYIGLSAYWASHGYVVIKPTHADSGRVAEMQAASDIWQSQTPADWMNRVRDITFILDSLDTIEQRYPELQGKIDRTKIGVGGHSYGAYTAMLIGGARTFPGGTSYADPRVKAIVAMSPQGPGEARGLTNESYAQLRVPALFMTGTRDAGVTQDETPEWRQQAYELSPAGDKWLVVLEGARHGTFTGRFDEFEAMSARDARMRTPVEVDPATGQPIDTRASRAQIMSERARGAFGTARMLALAFWDLYLRGDAEGRTELERTRGGVAVQKK
ncbi:MAG TPA: alpha/beta fold hydrolase [Thermoanaerobaculia bacterium]|jgi:predicted dienelactone hydrolase